MNLSRTLSVVDKPVQWMTVEELRAELERTRPAWESEAAKVDDLLATGEMPPLSDDAFRHRVVAGELMRREAT